MSYISFDEDIDPKDFKEVFAKIHAEFVFIELMKLPPEVRIPLYHKIMSDDTDKTA